MHPGVCVCRVCVGCVCWTGAPRCRRETGRGLSLSPSCPWPLHSSCQREVLAGPRCFKEKARCKSKVMDASTASWPPGGTRATAVGAREEAQCAPKSVDSQSLLGPSTARDERWAAGQSQPDSRLRTVLGSSSRFNQGPHSCLKTLVKAVSQKLPPSALHPENRFFPSGWHYSPQADYGNFVSRYFVLAPHANRGHLVTHKAARSPCGTFPSPYRPPHFFSFHLCILPLLRLTRWLPQERVT